MSVELALLGMLFAGYGGFKIGWRQRDEEAEREKQIRDTWGRIKRD